MPKAAVDEYAQSVLGEHQVRCSRQILSMQAIAKPHLMANRSHDHFRLRVFSLDHRHDLGAMFCGDYVCAHSRLVQRKIRLQPVLDSSAVFQSSFPKKLNDVFSSENHHGMTVFNDFFIGLVVKP